MIELFYYPGNASMAPHIVLEEVGATYRRTLVDRTQQVHRQPAYLKLNPNAQIPVLIDEGEVLYESAAICLHLADKFPAAGLLPAFGSLERAQAYKWLIWATNTMQETQLRFFYGDRYVDLEPKASAETVAEAHAAVKRNAVKRIAMQLDQIETQLARARGDWFLGEQFSVVDIYLMMLCRWTRMMEEPAHTRAPMAAWLERVLARPAVVRVFEFEGLASPSVKWW